MAKRVSAQEILEGAEPQRDQVVEAQDQIIDDYVPVEDGDIEIFPGGPTRKQVDTWKARYGEIYSSPFGDDVFIWRCMNRQEYKQVLQVQVPKGDTMYREEKICSICVLWPRGYNHAMMIGGKAGVPTLLAEQIMDKSGFTPTSEPERL
jgi:hypothetical protein